jgi:glycosyltransferase involved in cell wall biosynthesis
MLSPKVSVIIPAYNIERYITATLRSLLNQTCQNFEALIIDDGSTDRTAEKVTAFIQNDSRFKLLKKSNGGLSSARNFGIRHAQGEYIALLDGDDLYLPHKLSTHIDILDRNPSVGMVYSASQALRDDGTPTWLTISGKPLYSDSLKSLLCKNFVGHGSNGIFRKEIVAEIGDFDESLRSVEDLDFWLRLAGTRWKFYRVPSVQCYYRVRPAGLSFNLDRMQETQAQVMRSAYQRNPELSATIARTANAYFYRYLARIALTSGDRDRAKQFMEQAWESDASIFLKDPRSLLTLASIKLAPIAQFVIQRSLGKSQPTQPPC